MPVVSCQQIVIDDEDVKEMAGERTAVRLPRAEVTKLRVRHGFVAERPLVQAILGAGMLGGGGYVTLGMMAGSGPAPAGFRYLLASGLALLGSPFVLYGAVRRGYVLVVETRRGVRKLAFGSRVTKTVVANFVDDARAAGIDIRVETLLSGR